MMHFSQVQGVFIVEHYLTSRSYLTCQNEFTDTFPESPVLNKSTISRLVDRLSDTGSVQGRGRSGRPSSQILLLSPRKSLRKLSLQSGLSYGSAHKTTQILKLHPHRVHIMH
jgi:hypothetical protein